MKKLKEVLLSVDGVKKKSDEALAAEQEEQQRKEEEARLRAEVELKRKQELEEEERIKKHLSKMTENKQLNKTLELLTKGVGKGDKK